MMHTTDPQDEEVTAEKFGGNGSPEPNLKTAPAGCQYCGEKRDDLVSVQLWKFGALSIFWVCPEKLFAMHYPTCAVKLGFQSEVEADFDEDEDDEEIIDFCIDCGHLSTDPRFYDHNGHLCPCPCHDSSFDEHRIDDDEEDNEPED